MPKKKITNEIQDWYSNIPKSLLLKSHNPAYDQHKINLPFQMLILGPTGSTKTLTLIELIYRMPDTFAHIHIICRNRDEPLYKYLASKLKPEDLNITEGIDSIPNLDLFDKEQQNLVVFDDLVLEKNQKAISEYWIRSRKLNVSVIYLSQNFFGTPKPIRVNCSHIIIKKLSSMRDLGMIIKDFSLGQTKEELLAIYNYCTNDDKKNFLMIDIHSPVEKRFRKNLLEILQV